MKYVPTLLKPPRRMIALLAMTLAAIAGLSTPVLAGGLFSPVVYVNNDAITNFELDQRIALLKTLRTPGDLKKEALERLINERLQRQAGRDAGISLTPEDIKAGVDEFAKRLNLTGDEFLAKLAQDGVEADSFRDFVAAGLAWRQVVRAKFRPKATVSEAEIDRAIELQGHIGSARVQISEIFLPINTPKNEQISLDLAPKIANLRSFEKFADAARRFSAGASRDNGGQVDGWIAIDDLPPLIRPIILKLRPGEVTEPVEIPNALALFQLRAIQETRAPPVANPVLDYMAYYIDGGRSPAALARADEVTRKVDTCDDLYGIAKGQPDDVLERQTLELAKVPTDVALELAKLDAGEVSTALTRADGDTLVFLMLCGRSAVPPEEISRDELRQKLISKRLASYAQNYLDALRANASIRKP